MSYELEEDLIMNFIWNKGCEYGSLAEKYAQTLNS